MRQQLPGLFLFLMLVGVVSAIAVIGTHLGDPAIRDEAEFYRAAVPQNSLLHFTYYCGEYSGFGSITQMSPTWHPAAYVILLRAWLVLTGVTSTHARLFGVLCLIVAFLGTGFLLVRRCWLTLLETQD